MDALFDLPPATLKDVAREAGVSLATVDRVLHGRPGVRDRTVQKVNETIARLGFRPMAAAAQLARSRSLRIGFVMPRGTNSFMANIAEQVKGRIGWLSARRVAVEFIETDVFDAETLARQLERLRGRLDGVAVVALDHPLVRAAIDDLVEDGTSVVTLVSDVPTSKRHHFVGIDNIAAGRSAATLIGRFLGGRTGKIGIIAGSIALRDHAERLFGLNQVIALEYPSLVCLAPEQGRDDPQENLRIAERLLAEVPDLVAIYNAGEGSSGVGQALKEASREKSVVFIGHELTRETRRLLLDGVADALVVQDAGHEARSASRVLHALMGGGEINAEQERIRVEIILRDNLPTE